MSDFFVVKSRWGIGVLVLTAAWCVVALSCADDDDDDDEDVSEECPDVGETTCLDYCLCQRSQCGEDQSADICDAAMCECADFYGCLIEDVVSEYDCQAVS